MTNRELTENINIKIITIMIKQYSQVSVHVQVLLLCLILWVFTIKVNAQQNVANKPNVLFISVDDLNDWISPLKGHTTVQTPNFDRLAEMGVTFTNAQCTSPVCSPSRISIMTGVHAARSGIMNNPPNINNHLTNDGPLWRNNPVLKDVLTIDEFFKKNGYTTLAGGKIYHTVAPPWAIVNQADPNGWDFWFPSISVPVPYQIRARDEQIRHPDWEGVSPTSFFTWAPLSVSDEKMADYQVVEWARYELQRNHEKPLFLAVGLFRPHMPWEVPQKYFDMYPLSSIPDLKIKKNDLDDSFDHGRRLWHKYVMDNDQWKRVIQAYLASVSFVDAQLGRLLDGLERSQYRSNTIVVLWSDHGMHIGEKENWEKFTLWEESAKVPMFLMAPDLTKGGSRINTPVSTIDLYPTLAELIGQAAPSHCDGQSLVPLIKNPKAQHPPPVTAFDFNIRTNRNRYNENLGLGPSFTVRSINYRYIYYPTNGLEELYDHRIDPDEWDNIAYDKKNRKIISKHRNYLRNSVADIEWTEKTPRGYTIINGKIKKSNFVPLDELAY